MKVCSNNATGMLVYGEQKGYYMAATSRLTCEQVQTMQSNPRKSYTGPGVTGRTPTAICRSPSPRPPAYPRAFVASLARPPLFRHEGRLYLWLQVITQTGAESTTAMLSLPSCSSATPGDTTRLVQAQAHLLYMLLHVKTSLSSGASLLQLHKAETVLEITDHEMCIPCREHIHYNP